MHHTARPLALALLLVPLTARAQAHPAETLPGSREPRVITRGGVFATRDAVLRPGYAVASARTADFEHDGQPDALLVVRPAPNNHLDVGAMGGIVYARHTAQGWTAPYETQDDDHDENRWGPAFQVAGHVLFTTANRQRVGGGHDEPSETSWVYGLLAPDAAGALTLMGGHTNADDASLTDSSASLVHLFAIAPAQLEFVSGRRHRFERIDWTTLHFASSGDYRPDDGSGAAQRIAPIATTPGLPDGYCMAWPLSGVHLRPTATLEAAGPELAAASLHVLGIEALQRGDARLYHVQVQATGSAPGAVGYAFLLPGELGPECPWP